MLDGPSALSDQKSLTLAEEFGRIYQHGVWGNGSGPGSAPENVRPYLEYLQRFIAERGIKTIVDCGCGDWQSTRFLDLSRVGYLGVDVVGEVVERNRATYGKPNISFHHGDFSRINLPPADLIICKDSLQHLDDDDVDRLLRQLHKYKYALLTNDIGNNVDRNRAISANEYRFAPLDLCRAPFSLTAERVLEVMDTKVTYLVTDTKQPISYSPIYEAEASTPRVPDDELPTVALAILAKQKEAILPFYLDCIEALDYPKHRIDLYVRTNNNTDRTTEILGEWLQRVGGAYRTVHFDASDIDVRVEQFGVHEWNPVRFKALAAIRQRSLQWTLEQGSDFYFVVDVDNFLRPNTLRSLVALDLPVVAPLLRHVEPENPYSNYHYVVDETGYYRDHPTYFDLLHRRIRGIVEIEVAHCTYLVRRAELDRLVYDDGSDRYEYVIFADSARKRGVPQFLDNRQVYGYLTLDESDAVARGLIGIEIRGRLPRTTLPPPVALQRPA